MLVTIDESGDSGFKFDHGSSLYFVVAAIIFPDPFTADACDRSIDCLRRSLKLPTGYEFHFSECSDRVRHEFLRTLAHEQFRYHAFVLNKRKLYGKMFSDRNGFYQFTVSTVCDNARELLRDAKITIDECGDRRFKRELAKYLKAKMTEPDGTCLIKKLGMESSRSNNLVQLADMVCGAVARSYNVIGAKGSAFRNRITRREARVQFWPKE